MLLAPIWKKIPSACGVSDDFVLRTIAEERGPLVTGFISENIYLRIKKSNQVAEKLRDIPWLISALNFHGEIGVDKLVLDSDEIVGPDLELVNLLSRKIKLISAPETQTLMGSASGSLLKHGRKRASLLNLEIETLADHAWMGCAFSFDESRSVSSGAAAILRDGSVFRAGAIGRFVTARQAVEVGLELNGRGLEEVAGLQDCSIDKFEEHRWYRQFTP